MLTVSCRRMETPSDAKISQFSAFLEQHRIAAVLEACISSVLCNESSDVIAALAVEIERYNEEGGIGRKGATCQTVPPHRISDAQARINDADLNEIVGEAVSNLLEDMPAQPLVALAQHLRSAAAKLTPASDRAEASNSSQALTQKWSRLVAEGWANAARISVGACAGGSPGGGSAAEEQLLHRVTRQVDI